MKTPIPSIFTIGHSTRTIEEFLKILHAYKITLLVDVRTIPKSRHNPQFNLDTLPLSLNNEKINYLHMPNLGGLRHAKKDSLNTGWRNASFRGFADYMQTPEFHNAIEELIELAKKDTISLMCAEAVPSRCHRSLIADALFIRGIICEDIISEKKAQPHKLTPFAKIEGSQLIYPTE